MHELTRYVSSLHGKLQEWENAEFEWKKKVAALEKRVVVLEQREIAPSVESKLAVPSLPSRKIQDANIMPPKAKKTEVETKKIEKPKTQKTVEFVAPAVDKSITSRPRNPMEDETGFITVTKKKSPLTVRGTRKPESDTEDEKILLDQLRIKEPPHRDFCVRGLRNLINPDYLSAYLKKIGVEYRFVRIHVRGNDDLRGTTFARIGTFEGFEKVVMDPASWPTNITVRPWKYYPRSEKPLSGWDWHSLRLRADAPKPRKDPRTPTK
jgi:hypothetical protein